MQYQTAEPFNAKDAFQPGSGRGSISPLLGRIYAEKIPLFHQGDHSDGLFKVRSGVVMTYRLLEDSRRQITGFCTAGDFFGMSSNDIHHDTAITVTTCNIMFLTKAELRKNPKIQKDLFYHTCSQLENAQEMMMTLSKKTAAQKVASFLLMFASHHTGKARSTHIQLPMARLDIADYLGMSIETVSRRLTDFKTEGVISLPDRHVIHIHKMDVLKKLAGAQN